MTDLCNCGHPHMPEAPFGCLQFGCDCLNDDGFVVGLYMFCLMFIIGWVFLVAWLR